MAREPLGRGGRRVGRSRRRLDRGAGRARAVRREAIVAERLQGFARRVAAQTGHAGARLMPWLTSATGEQRELRDGDVIVGSGPDSAWPVTSGDLMPRHFII